MARQVKNEWLGARIDRTMSTRVDEYTRDTEMSMGDLVREAVNEYMLNHPVKDPKTKIDTTKLTAPGV